MTLVSPGVQVTITDDSFFIPVSAPTVPLIFVATADEKFQPDGVTPAEGTYEHSVVRTITSLNQSIQTYGVPKFLRDAGTLEEFHGDARNEYGLFALNQYLGIGNRAYVIRANVNLNDDFDDLQSLWDSKILEAKVVLQNLVSQFIDEFNTANGLISGTFILTASQTQANYDGAGSNGTFTGGDETLISGQSEADYDGAGTNGTFVGGDGAGGTAYAPGDTITLDNGAVITVGTVDANDDVLTFTVDTAGNNFNVGATLTQSSTSGAGTGFTLTPAGANVTLNEYAPGDTITLNNGAVITVGTVDANGDVTGFTVTSVGGYVSASVALTQSSTSGSGSGFTLTPETANIIGFKQTVTATEYQSLVDDATDFIFDPVEGSFSFIPVASDFLDDQSASPLNVYADGYDMPSTGTFEGLEHVSGDIGSFPSLPGGATVAGEFTAAEGGDLLVALADDFKFTTNFLNKTSLGANDTARRASIVTALQAAINSNTEIRSETFDYNLILAPGYPEVVDELLALTTDIGEEALVIGDTPVDETPDGITNPSTGWATTTERQSSANVAYYYPWPLASNIDGRNVVVAPSGTALRQYAFSDDVSFLWFAPAGTRRGVITGITDLGYVSGTLGSPTEFVPVALNQGQLDALYQDQPSGRINPLLFRPGQGFLVWGQKTSPSQPSAMDRVNVSRLVKYIKRQLRRNTLSFVFEPNDQLTRDNLKAVVDNFLGDLVVKRGLYDFASIADESNNTPDRIDRNEMYVDVAIKPIKAAEFIFIPIRIVATGAEI